MKKYLSFLFLFALVLVPAVSFGQIYSATVSKVINNPVIKKYTPPVNTTVKANEPATALKKNSKYDPLVALLQATLTNLGTNPGKVDGINGTQTVNALKEVQRFFGLKPDGIYGKEAQKLFSVLPINSSIRTTDPTVAIALKKYVKAQLALTSTSTPTTQNTTGPTKLATIPFTPKGISQALSKNLSLVGLTQTSEATILGKKLTAKPKLLTNGTKVALYKVNTSNNLNITASSGAVLNTNFASGSGKSNAVYVCGNINNTSICVPVSPQIADAINKGTITLEQYLASKSANGDVCIQCILDENGDLGVIIGGEDDSPIIPPGPNVVNAANVVDMCVDYPARGTGNVVYEITFDKPVNVMYSSGLTLDVVRYYNAPSKKVTATYAGAPDGTVAGKTIRFQAPASQLSSIYYEGEATLKSKSGAKIVVAATGETVDLSLLTDVFRLSNTCSGEGKSYDITDTSVELSPDKLYSGETFDSPRMNVNVKFSQPVTVVGNLKLLMNPADTGGTAVGKLVSNGSTASDTLVFHFNSTTGSGWSNIFGTFGFDPGSGSVKNSSGANMLLNMPIGNDATGGHCATKRIGQPCLELVGGEAKYTVYYDRTIEVTNAGNNSIRLKVEPLNPAAPDVIANLTSYDAHHLYFKAPATTTLVSDYTGHYWLQVDPPSKVFTINGTLESLGHDDYGSNADPDMGVSGATCSGSGDEGPTVSDLCMNSNGEISYSYRVKFNEPMTVVGAPELKIQKTAAAPIVTATYDGYDDTDHTTLKFTAQIGAGPNTGIGGQFYEGVGTLAIVSGSSIKNSAGQNAPTSVGTFAFSDACAPGATVIEVTEICRGDAAWPSVAQTITAFVKFSEPVTVTGSPSLRIIRANGADGVTLNYSIGSGTDTLKFHYIVPDPLPANFNYVKEDFEGDYAFKLPLASGVSIKTASGANVNLDGRWTAPPGNLCPIPESPNYDPNEVARATCLTKKVTGNSGHKFAELIIGTDKDIVIQGIPKLLAWSLDANPPAQVLFSYVSGNLSNLLKFTATQTSAIPDESFDFVNTNNQFMFQYPAGSSIKTLSPDGLFTYHHGVVPGTPGLPECSE